MDLPKAVHALLFDRHAGMDVRKEADGVRIRLSEPGGSVEICSTTKPSMPCWR